MGKFKQLIAIIIIVIVIIILDFILEKNTNNVINIMNEKLTVVDEMLEEIDSTEEKSKDVSNISEKDIKKATSEMVEEWSKKEKILTCYIEHDEIEKINDKIKLVKKQVKIENPVDARQAIEEAKFLLEHLKEKEKVTLENIL